MQRGRMLKNKDVVSVENNLMAGNYHQLFSNLRRLGRSIKQAWFKSLSSNNTEKYKFTSNNEFKKFLVNEIKESNVNAEPTEIKDISQYIYQFKKQLSRLSLVLIVWKDDPKLAQESESGTNKKRLRQLIKYKSPLDKDDRYAINIALQSMAFILCQQTNKFIQQQEKKIGYALTEDEIKQFITSGSKQDLLNFISKHIQRLNKFESERYLNVTHEDSSLSNQREVEKIAEAISAFQTPNKKKKLLKYIGIFLAFIASLACGLSTGGAIFLVFPSLPILGISLGAVIGLFGFTSNFGFFSQNFPNFILSFLKKGGITEYIDTEGKRRQLSTIKKYLFIPLAIVASITVGMGTFAITYTTVLALTAKLLPILALIWPPFPLIIVGILATAVGITLTVAVLTATIAAIKNSQDFTWASVKEKIENLSNLQIVGYLFKGLLVLIGLFGLAYFRYTAGLDLSQAIGPISAGITGVIAFIPQAFFTVFSIQKLIKLFSPSHTQQKETSIKSIFYRVYTFISLIGNAFGNAALVVVDNIKNITVLCIGGAVGCFFNSWSGNLPESDVNQDKRKEATQGIVKDYEDFLTESKKEKSTTPAYYSHLTREGDNSNGRVKNYNMVRAYSADEPLITGEFRRRSVSDPGASCTLFKPVKIIPDSWERGLNEITNGLIRQY